jgi:phenylacetate-coenzyme A ligase PaaK-like adenylate-forming protein
LGVAGEGECACASPHGHLKEFSGRTDGVVRLPSGRSLTARLLTGPLARYHCVRRFRIVQEARDRLVVEVVADDGLEEVADGIRDDLRAATGGEVELEVRRVESIQLTPGRKQVIVVAMPDGQAPSASGGGD